MEHAKQCVLALGALLDPSRRDETPTVRAIWWKILDVNFKEVEIHGGKRCGILKSVAPRVEAERVNEPDLDAFAVWIHDAELSIPRNLDGRDRDAHEQTSLSLATALEEEQELILQHGVYFGPAVHLGFVALPVDPVFDGEIVADGCASEKRRSR